MRESLTPPAPGSSMSTTGEHFGGLGSFGLGTLELGSLELGSLELGNLGLGSPTATLLGSPLGSEEATQDG